MKISIQEIDKETIEFRKINIEPEVIFNRPDILQKNYVLLFITNVKGSRYLFIEINDNVANAGSFFMPITLAEAKAVNRYIFRKYKNIDEINWINILFKFGVWKNTFQKVIDLPTDCEDLKKRLTSKSRQNLRRKQRLIKEQLGDFRFEVYENNVPSDIVESYFAFKYVTHDCDYHMTPREYLRTYCVSTAYVMRTAREILAILFSCEQCECVYFENFTYNAKYSSYSLGRIIYDFFLEQLVRKGKKSVFLGGGTYEYKKKYGSKEVHAYVCKIYRSKIKNIQIQGKRKWNYYRNKLQEHCNSKVLIKKEG